MSNKYLEDYELFFAEIPRDYDYLSAIIDQDEQNNETVSVQTPQNLSCDQVERLAEDSRTFPPDTDSFVFDESGDNLFSHGV